MQKAFIQAIEYYLPETILDNHALSAEFPEFSVEKIFNKTGINKRHLSLDQEYSSDMAVHAAQKLFALHNIPINKVDFLLFCTQTPDSLLPTNACMIQERLGLNTTVGAFDFNLGCSGYIYGLLIAKSLIESNQANHVLLLTADTYSKLLDKKDKSVRTIFGDGATATFISACSENTEGMSSIAYGTDGLGANNLFAKNTSFHILQKTSDPFLRMKGAEIFKFTLEVVPNIIHQALEKAKLQFEEIELFVFHQANAYMLEHLRKKLSIPSEKFWIAMDFCGNTVSSTIPIALKEAQKQGKLLNKTKVMLVGFGIGYSWGATIINPAHIT